MNRLFCSTIGFLVFVSFALPAIAQVAEEVPTAASKEGTQDYEDVKKLKELESSDLSPSILGTGAWNPMLFPPHSGTLMRLREDVSGTPTQTLALGANLLVKPEIQDRFSNTQVLGLIEHEQPSIRAYLDFFDGRGKPILAGWIARMGRFEPMIRQTLSEAGLPEDLIFVAMIESGFSPRATSPAAAVGVWQFIPTTGSEMGLQIDRYVDERRDPIKATRAACEYLKFLHDRFGSWPLALAAYNGGPGLVGKTIRKFNSNDYWFIQRQGGLYDETRRYVPKILAAGLVTKNADLFGLGGIKRVKPFEFDVVQVARNTRLAVFAKASGTTLNSLKALNPELLRAQTPPGTGLYALRIPKDSTQKFVANYDKIKTGPTLEHSVHVTRFGETLKDVANTYNMPVRVLRAANGLSSRARVPYGTSLMVPKEAVGSRKRSAKTEKKSIVVPATLPTPDSGLKRYFYTARSTDTVNALSRALSVNPGDVYLWNFLDPNATLQSGMVLQVYLSPEADVSNVLLAEESSVTLVVAGSASHKKMKKKRKKKKRFYHKVRSGESLWTIARKYRVTVGDLKKWNRSVRKSNMLQPGQKIVVYPGKRSKKKRRR